MSFMTIVRTLDSTCAHTRWIRGKKTTHTQYRRRRRNERKKNTDPTANKTLCLMCTRLSWVLALIWLVNQVNIFKSRISFFCCCCCYSVAIAVCYFNPSPVRVFSNMSFAFKVLCGGEANIHTHTHEIRVRDRLVRAQAMWSLICDEMWESAKETRFKFNRIAPFGFDGWLSLIPAKLIP